MDVFTQWGSLPNEAEAAVFSVRLHRGLCVCVLAGVHPYFQNSTFSLGPWFFSAVIEQYRRGSISVCTCVRPRVCSCCTLPESLQGDQSVWYVCQQLPEGCEQTCQDVCCLLQLHLRRWNWKKKREGEEMEGDAQDGWRDIWVCDCPISAFADFC